MNISLFGIFIEGLLSFLSPCVLPLIPLYISYLGGENYKNKKDILINTFSFVLGIVTTFIIFGMSISFFKEHILKYQEVISIIGGTIIIVFALHEIGLINISSLNKEFSYKEKLNLNKMSFLKAYLFGFLFSFAWSPCIGPLLANALLMAATNTNGILYLVAFALGLIIPFIIAGLFSSFILDFINNKKNISQYVTRIAGIIMLCFGIYMIYNASTTINNYKNLITNPVTNNVDDTTNHQEVNQEEVLSMLLNTEYYDSKGNKVKLSDYKDKYIYLNFVASWCTYCRQEVPSYIKFAEDNKDDSVCLYVFSPTVNGEKNIEGIKEYTKQQGMDELSCIIDENGSLFYYFGASSYPMKFVIAPNQELLGYLAGALTDEIFIEFKDAVVQMYDNQKN